MPKIYQTCSVDDCTKTVKALKLCAMHWKRLKFHGDVNKVLQRGGHNKIAELCSITNCGKPYIAQGFCQMHYRRWDLYGDPNYTIPKKQYPQKYTYVLAVGHPNANANGTIAEHRLVMSELLGRPLVAGENVHHINGDGKDNRPENLELWHVGQPAGQRVEDKVEFALEILRQYAPHYLEVNA